jgi:hypothetical protein
VAVGRRVGEAVEVGSGVAVGTGVSVGAGVSVGWTVTVLVAVGVSVGSTAAGLHATRQTRVRVPRIPVLKLRIIPSLDFGSTMWRLYHP